MQLLTLEGLRRFKEKIDEYFVSKEYKTGSTTVFRTLSDNNLTDELVEKINAAGAETVVTENIATAKSEAITESNSYTDTEVAEGVAESKSYTDTAKSEAVTTSNSYTDTEVSEALAEAKSYADTAETDAVASANSYTDEQVEAAKAALQTDINTKISTAYKVKGSSAFADLPTLSAAEEGYVWNITDAFTTTDAFVEGAGKKYLAGTNIVCIEESEGVFKFDVLPGFIDTDSFVLNSDIETITETEINGMFSA